MQCMLQTAPTTVLMGGHQQELVEFDLNTNTQTKTVKSIVHILSLILRLVHTMTYVM